MEPIMWIIFLFIIAQRISELIIAKRNERWMKARGGIETGGKHYKWFVILHSLFFAAVIFEGLVRDAQDTDLNFLLLYIFVITQVVRIWCIISLGKFWNTKIIVLPEFSLIKKGPYKYIKHPNYIIVGIELFIIPLLFGAFITAIIFPVLHILLLTIRIPSEERALAAVNLNKNNTGEW